VRGLLGLFGIRLDANMLDTSAYEELRGAVEVLNREGALEKHDRDRLGGLLDLEDLEVADLMIHRTKVVSIDVDDKPEDIVAEVLASPYTRLPVWRDQNDNIIGILHAKDVLRALSSAGNDAGRLDVTKIMTQPWFVPDTTPIKEQLNAFLRRKTHMAIVVDEYGEMEGLVTLEDIIEEIVGDIADEHDTEISGVKPQPDGSVIVDGTVPIRDLNRALDWSLPDDEFNTVAGLVIHEAKTIPAEKQTFTFHGKRFVVMKRDRNRIAKLRIRAV
jgi:Mg2+/Co2+ transporter CorB